MLLGRERNRDFGIGPFAEVSTAGFWDARYGGGLSVLAPVTPNFPLVLSLGAERATLVSVGFERDALLLAMPFLFAAGELR